MDTIASSSRSARPGRRGFASPSRGLSLIFALLALGLLSLAAVALVRSVNTGALVLGNLGFKQDATASSDQVADAAITWLQSSAGGATLNNDDVTHGYLAAAVNLDPTGSNSTNTARAVVDWANDGCASYGSGTFASCVTPAAGPTINGHSTQYVIVRLCPAAGAVAAGTNDCSGLPPGLGGGQHQTGDSVNNSVQRNGFDYFNYERLKVAGSSSPQGQTYFRVISRVVGGRQSVSYTETIVHF